MGADAVRMYHDQALFKESGAIRTPWHQDQFFWPLDKVCDVQPDGRSLNVVDSIERTTDDPGRPQDADVRVGSTAIQFCRGHRIRVLVASSEFPQYDLLPPGEQTLFLGSSRVVLPGIDPRALEHG